MKTLKTLFKSAAVAAVLGSAIVTAQAVVVIGSFQGASDPLNSQWIDVNDSLPITTSTNCSFPAAGVAGYSQSLDVSAVGHEGSFGYPSFKIQLSPAEVAAFNTNSWLTFTFSVPGGTYGGGYSQIYNLAIDAEGYSYANHSWATVQFSGSTNSDSAGNGPGFTFNNGANSLQTQTVTVNYSDITNAIIAGGESYIEITWQGNQGGGAPTDFLINNVTLSTAPFGNEGSPSIVIDQFNPTNNPYAGTNIYAAGQITNVYGPWFGNAVNSTNGSISWDPDNDADGNTNSGSLKIVADFTGAGSQWIITDAAIGAGTGPGITPPITNNYSLLTFEFDVKYDPSSPTWTNGTTVTYGELEWGIAGGPVGGYSGTGYGSVQVNVTNTGWTHVIIPLDPKSDADFASIGNIFFKQDGGSYGDLVGTSTVWLDNLKFTYTNVPPVIPPPTVSIEKAKPALRIFAADTSANYSRAEVATSDNGQSWISPSSYPVSYSFQLLSYPTDINQTHIFLVPANYIPSGNAPYGNEYVEYQSSNALWLDITNIGNGTVAAWVLWKTNLPNSNPNQVALVFTNSTAIGTWTLTFNSANSGMVTAPGNSSVAFTIPDPNISTDFANPLTAYFGLQPNTGAGEGEYEDWGSITVTGVAGVNENENFTTETSDFNPSTHYSPSGEFRNDSSEVPAGVVIVNSNDQYWVNWTLPAVNYDIGSSTNLFSTDWISPAYYSSFNDETAPRGASIQIGTKMWELLPTDDLPTVDGNPGSPVAPTAFFTVTTNVDYNP